jgi:murein DD-endopeptidase MepM/ murein hydrolase activator NlpD
MRVGFRTLLSRTLLNFVLLLALTFVSFCADYYPTAHAQGIETDRSSIEAAGLPVNSIVSGHILSDGQFVYGPNVGDFNINSYLEENAPHLLVYANDLYSRTEFFSINPKILLTMLEVHGHLISNPDPSRLDNPFNLPGMDFITQIESVSQAMTDAYYLHLYTYTALPSSQRNLPVITTQYSESLNIASDTNAGTYAVIAGLARFESKEALLQIMDNNHPDGFYHTYLRLFGDDDPLDESNHVYYPGEAGALAAPDNFLQLPYLRGESWRFGGVHDSSGGGGSGSPFTDASSMDFFPGSVSWNADTSNMWVVASAAGTPTKISACYFKVTHSDGWETTYYHLENIQNISGSINQNDKIGVIANTLAEAICSGGSSTGPHVHFSLRRNGALVAINGTPLSGWYVHAGRWNYDTDHNYMWLERSGQRKYPFSDWLLSEASSPTTFADVPTYYWAWSYIDRLYAAQITGGCGDSPLIYCPENSVTRAEMAIFLERGINGSAYTPPVETGAVFGDVPTTYWSASWIEKLYADGITGGCGGGNYCPENSVTRAQMAVFLLRAKHGSSYTPPTATGMFADVPTSYWAANWIEQLNSEGITGGCGGGNYCPENPVTRAQMAIFLVRTFGLP